MKLDLCNSFVFSLPQHELEKFNVSTSFQPDLSFAFRSMNTLHLSSSVSIGYQ
ncbi:hypothetical protein HOLleu_41146 [Holothuria leucospilota]|uniref:Uncharacterized protein n=1 Tax=Holothuria leucospilota TaxID=206669 RepID=A0A9Q1BCH0_HOLLE|nr:hypothetical protein HOLleu_41146 [Holothuria leucospilota]